MKETAAATESPSGSRVAVAPSTPAIGAEISGIDLREPLTLELRDELRRLLLRHRVLFWRDQHLSTEEQIAFAEAFGPILVFSSVARRCRAGSSSAPLRARLPQPAGHVP